MTIPLKLCEIYRYLCTVWTLYKNCNVFILSWLRGQKIVQNVAFGPALRLIQSYDLTNWTMGKESASSSKLLTQTLCSYNTEDAYFQKTSGLSYATNQCCYEIVFTKSDIVQIPIFLRWRSISDNSKCNHKRLNRNISEWRSADPRLKHYSWCFCFFRLLSLLADRLKNHKFPQRPTDAQRLYISYTVKRLSTLSRSNVWSTDVTQPSQLVLYLVLFLLDRPIYLWS